MGMGEPLANLDAVWTAIERLHEAFGLSARHITVSTVGVVPGMRALAEKPLPVTLAVSLHAPDDALRNQLVPLNHRYPISDVLDAARDHARSPRPAGHVRVRVHRRGERPSAPGPRPRGPAARVPGRCAREPHPPQRHRRVRGPTRRARERIVAFAETLRGVGVTATIRRNRGTDIDAACGQLRDRALGQPVAVVAPGSRPSHR